MQSGRCTTASDFAGKTFVVRIDEATAQDAGATLVGDLAVLAAHHVRPIVVAPDPLAARAIVRAINRSANVALALSGSDAALLPDTPTGIGRVQTRILHTLTGAGFIPVVEPTAFALFGETDRAVVADDVAAAIAAATEAARAIFFHRAGGVPDPQTNTVIGELTPAEALALADDPRVDPELRRAIRAAATGVRAGIPAAQILDGRVAHATVVEVLTSGHLGTQVTGGIILAV
jgi:acetylglutamate kinase